MATTPSGKILLAGACARHDIDLDALLAELRAVRMQPMTPPTFDT